MMKEQGQVGLSRRGFVKLVTVFGFTLLFDPLRVMAGGIENQPGQKEVVYIPKNLQAEQYRQQYTFSCEVAAIKIVLFHYPEIPNPSEEELQDQLGTNSNPDLGFRGDYWAFSSNNLANYGAHAPAIKNLVENSCGRGLLQTKILHDLDQVREELAQNHLVLLWIPVGLDNSYRQEVVLENGERVSLVPGEHTVVAHGFDRSGFSVYDPSPTGYHFDYAGNDLLAQRMSLFDHPALSIIPNF